MIISRKRGYIFVHIPKTGGTSMALALEARAAADDILIGDTPKARQRRRRLAGVKTTGRLWKHSRLADLPGLIEEDEMRAMFVFTLVRNPWDRAVSYYHWLRVQTFDHPAVVLSKHLEFAAFLKAPQTIESLRSAPFSHYVTLPSGAEQCQAFVRLEHLEQDLQPVEAHLGFGLSPLPRSNASRRPASYGAAYCAETVELVGRICAEDVARFGYRFEGPMTDQG